MLKTFCLSTFAILLSCIKAYCYFLPDDSTGKKIFIVKPVKRISLKQSIVKTACEEFAWWRSDTTLRESDEKAVARLKQYWLSVGRQTRGIQLRDSLWQEQHPWSSAFISWVMTRAGAGKKFKTSPNHAGYIVWARKNLQSKCKEIFIAYDICDQKCAWPEPGDLICKNRDGNNFSLSTITASDISHSDIVVEVDTVRKAIVTIGGNVRNTVSKRIIYLDADGYIDRSSNWKVIDEAMGNPEGSQSEFFAIIKLKADKPGSEKHQTIQYASLMNVSSRSHK
jgi:hypothetical protein